MSAVCILFVLLRALLLNRLALSAENLALRQQLALLKRQRPRPKWRWRDRVFWVLLSRCWRDWRSHLVLVQPDTVVRWHRRAFAWYWRWRPRPGRPPVADDVRELIHRMSRDNPTWGTPRLRDELRLLGHNVSKATIDKYRFRPPSPPSPSWRSFLNNHVADLASVDFFTIPTFAFQVLYVFVVLRHDRRRVVHFNVTTNPTAQWVARQVTEAFPYQEAPRYLLRDRDGVYGHVFREHLKTMGIEQVLSAPRSPWQNPYVERLIGTFRRECLNHVIVLNEAHLRRLLTDFLEYYHRSRPHQSLGGNSPDPREIEPPERGPVKAIPQVGGLHHRYTRAA